MPSIKELGSDKFWADLYKKSVQKEVPISGSFELTYQCNLRCQHCYVSIPKNSEELSYSEVCSILDQLAEIGCFHLNLTGGEIFTRPDLVKVLEYAKKKGFYVILLTNGTLITPEIADCLKELNINKVDISLYGMSETTYESVTQVPGSFQKCLEGIELLRRRNIPMCLKITVLTLNMEEFVQVKAFAEKLKVRFQWGYFIHPKIDGSKEPLKFRISAEEAINLEIINQPHLFDEERNRREKKEVSSRRDSFFYCNAGRNSLAITPYGELNLCLEHHFPGYDLRKGSLSEGWKELVNYVKSAEPGKNYQCKDCDLEEFCQWCPAEGWLERGDRSACVPYFKKLAQLRSERMENG